MFWNRKKKSAKRPRAIDREARKLRAEVEKLRAELDVERRVNEVLTAENEKLAAVVARDLERVKAETAIAARRRAESEGIEGLFNDNRAH